MAKQPAQVLAWKAPIRTRNSPTKPLVPGQADRGQHEHHEHDGIDRHAVDEAAIARDLARVHAVVDDADAQEQRARDDAVAQHLEDGALHALVAAGEDAERHEAHMRDRRIGDQLLHVLLRQRDQRGVDDGDDESV